eukprot:maker-scaffold_18-snap-gene-6.5-mRNA-1 protein AED:0.15 eAED:0.15 QI:90/0.66/0.5/1/0/0/4/0/164
MKGQSKLLNQVHNLMAKGVISKPKWYDPFIKTPPVTLETNRSKLKQIVFLEDKLLRTYMKKNPDYKKRAVTSVKYDELPASIFVSKQAKLMSEGLSEEEAYTTVLNQTTNLAKENAEVEDVVQDVISAKDRFEKWTAAENKLWESSKESVKGIGLITPFFISMS